MNNKENPLRICLLVDSFYPVIGGGEKHARLLSEKLIAAGTPVYILTQRRIKGSKSREMVRAIRVIRVAPTGMKRAGKYIMQLPAFLYLLKHRSSFDILFVCGLRAVGLMAVITAKLLGKKCILRSESCDEMKSEHIINAFGFLKSCIRQIISVRNKLLFQADGFIAISEAIRQEYLECGTPPYKIKDIPNGIDTRMYYPVGKEEKKYLRISLNLPSEKIIFSYTGKLNRGKGLEMLLRVWRNIALEYDDVLLVLVGSGGNQFLSCEKELKDYSTIEDLNQSIIFTGYVQNVADYLRATDYFVLPSESEAHPLSLLEALSCGIPSIATKAGGVVDIIEDKKNGRLIEVNDESMLLQTIMEFLRHPETVNKYREAGLETIKLYYSIDLIVSQYLSYFKKISETDK